MPSANDNTFNPAFDRFKHLEIVPLMTPRRALAVNPADGSDLPWTAHALWIGVGGDVHVLLESGDDVTFRNVPNGTRLDGLFYRVFNSGTGASGIIALG